MDDKKKTKDQLIREIEELRTRLMEAEEGRLRSSNEILERMFSSTHTLLAYLDRDFNFIRVNERYAKADQKDPEYFIGKNHFDLYPHAENEAIFRRVVETGEPFSIYEKPFEFPQHPEYGVTYWDWSLHPVKDSSGEVEGLVFSLVDVTERVRAREKAEGLDEKLRTRAAYLDRLGKLIETSTKVLSETTLEGLLNSVVIAARELTGAKVCASGHGYREGGFHIVASRAEGVPPCPPGEVFYVDKGGVYYDLIKEKKSFRLTDGEMRSHPAWWGLPEGHTPLRGLLGASLVGRGEDPTGLIMVSDKAGGGDFTEEDEAVLVQLAATASLGLKHIEARDEAERRANEAEEGKRILDALMEHVPEGITIADAPDVKIRMVSSYGLEMVGRPREVIEGITADEHPENWHIYHPDGVTLAAPEELPLTRAVCLGETVIGEEWVIKRPDGSSLTVLCNAGPVTDDEGTVTGGVIAWRDITEKKNLERERADFVAMVTHDMKSPLTAILGYLDLILDMKAGKLDADTLDMVMAIQKSCARLLWMFEDFIAISRMEAGKSAFNARMSDVADTLHEVREEFAAVAQRHRLTFVSEVAEDVGDAPVDRKLFQRAVSNLVQNAVTYTQEGGTVTLKAERAGEDIVISVSDTGPGIPGEEQAQVFDKYYRSHRTARTKGTGLGLAIVKAVADAHGGRVELYSPEGKGCTFRIILPAR